MAKDKKEKVPKGSPRRILKRDVVESQRPKSNLRKVIVSHGTSTLLFTVPSGVRDQIVKAYGLEGPQGLRGKCVDVAFDRERQVITARLVMGEGAEKSAEKAEESTGETEAGT